MSNYLKKFFFVFLLLKIAQAVHAQPETTRQYLWQTNSGGDDLHVIDIQSKKVVKRLILGANPHGIAAPRDHRVVYVSIENKSKRHGYVVWVDPYTYKVIHRIKVGVKPQDIETTPDGRWIYVPCFDGNYWIIDAEEKRIVKKIKTGGRPHNTTASDDGRYMYLSPLGEPRKVTIVDVASDHTVVGEIPFSHSVRPPALSSDNQLFFQQIEGLNGFEVADVQLRKVIDTVTHQNSLGWFRVTKEKGWLDLSGWHKCHGIGIRPDQQEIWSSCGLGVTVHGITEDGFPEIAYIPMIEDGYWLTFSPDNQYCFIALPESGKTAMVNVHTKEIMYHFDVGIEPKRNLIITLEN